MVVQSHTLVCWAVVGNSEGLFFRVLGLLRLSEFSTVIFIEGIWTSRGASFFNFEITNIYDKNFLHPLTTIKHIQFNFNTCEWRMSCRCRYIFRNILKSVQNTFLWAFSFFAQHSIIHILHHILSTPLIKSVFFRLFLSSVHYFPKLLICELHGSNSNVTNTTFAAVWWSSTVVPNRRATKTLRATTW